MTMFITVATVNKVIQASDRRISVIRNGIPEFRDDSTNKAVLVESINGLFTITYSGLAEINEIPTEKVIASIFSEINLKSASPKILFDSFIDKLSEKFSKIRIHTKYKDVLKTNISISGFLNSGDLFWLRVSNYLDKDENDIGVKENFKYYGRLIDSPSYRDKNKNCYIQIGGISDVHSKDILTNEILTLKRQKFFHRTSGVTIANTLVDIIRKFSKTPSAQNLVGQNCMTTVLNAPPVNQHEFRYHDNGDLVLQYGPVFVFNDGWLSDFQAGPVEKAT